MIDHYTVTLEWSPEDESFVARVLELPGCMNDGKTRGQAVKAIEFSIREWIAAARDLGLPIPRPAENVPYLTISDASVGSGISEAMLRRYIARGDLKAERVGRDWRIAPKALAELEQNLRPVGRQRVALTLSPRASQQLKKQAKGGDRAAKAVLAAARGESYGQIASGLGIAESTARTYVARYRRQTSD